MVIQGRVCHHRSRPKPRRAGRANSRPIAVTRVPHSIPIERADRPPGICLTEVSEFSHAAIESGRVVTTRKAATAHRGRRQAGKPWNRGNYSRREPPHVGSFIQAQSWLSTTQQPASRNFSQSPQGRDAGELPLPGRHGEARLVLAHLPGESTRHTLHFPACRCLAV